MTHRAEAIGRLRTADDFKRVASEGKRVRSRHLALTYLGNERKESRLGINVPVRAAKAAVRRNRLRRVISAYMRTMRGGIKPGYDIVVAVKADPGQVEGKVLRSELCGLMERCQLWRNRDD